MAEHKVNGSGPAEPSSRERLERERDRFRSLWERACAGEPPPSMEQALDSVAESERHDLKRMLLQVQQVYEPVWRAKSNTPPELANTVAPWEGTHQPHLHPAHTVDYKTPEQDPQATTGVPRSPDDTSSIGIHQANTWGEEGGGELQEIGSAVPGYRILNELGRGGMGVVYRALQVRLNRIVTLKMILAGPHAGTELLARFQTEAQAVAHLQHPNIVQIHEVGEHAGLPYLTLEFVDGGNLADHLEGRPMDPQQAARLLRPLTAAMDHAHQRGVLHRDLKPANVLLTADGTPKITDFGLAKLVESDSRQTQSGTILGSPSYMAPEQAMGDIHEVGPLADVYALGAILYEMLTGRPPFLAAFAMDIVMQVMRQEPVAPTRLQPTVPVDLETICLKCLQKDPGKRYASPAALGADLERFLAGEPILARPVSGPERLWRWCRRNPRVAILTAAVSLLLFATAVGSTTFAIVLAGQKREIEFRKQAAVTAEGLATKRAVEAEQAKAKADRASEEAMLQKREADDARALADRNAQAVRGIYAKTLEMLSDLVLNLQAKLNRPGAASVRKEAMQSIKDGFKNILAVVPESEDEMVELDLLWKIHRQAGDAYQMLGELELARIEYERSLEIAGRLVNAMEPDDASKGNLAASYWSVGDVDHLLGDLPAALRNFRQAQAIRDELWIKDKRPQNQQHQATGHIKLGKVHQDDESFELAEYHFRTARDLRSQLDKQYSHRVGPESRFALKRDHLVAERKLAELAFARGDAGESKRHYEKCFTIASELESDERSRLDRANLHEGLGLVLQQLGNTREAQVHFEKGLQSVNNLAQNVGEEINVQNSYMKLLARRGRHQDAAVTAERIRENWSDHVNSLFNVACCYSLCASQLNKSASQAETEAKTVADYVGLGLLALREAIEQGLKNRGMIENDPDLSFLRNDPRFAELLKRLPEEN